MSSQMTAVLPRTNNYKYTKHFSYGYNLRARNSIKGTMFRCAIIMNIDDTLCFKSPLEIRYKKEQDFFTSDFSVGGLVIATAEETLDEMVKDIKSQLKHAWDYYALEDDSNLNSDAIAVKRWLLKKVRKV